MVVTWENKWSFVFGIPSCPHEFGQTFETDYLNPKDSSANMFIAVADLRKQGIFTIIPIFVVGLLH